MRDGFVKVAARTPEVRVADVAFNLEQCVAACRAAVEQDGARVVVLPELSLTGATCGDLFWQDALLDAAEQGLYTFAEQTADLNALLFVGLPLRVRGALYDCAAAVCAGEVVALVPRTYPVAGAAVGSARHFFPAPPATSFVDLGQEEPVVFGANVLLRCTSMPDLVVGVELGQDLWAPVPPSVAHVAAGATLIVNLAATEALAGRADRARTMLQAHTARLGCAYAYASAGWGESTTDYVYAGQNLIVERGALLAEALPFAASAAMSEVDVAALVSERLRVQPSASLAYAPLVQTASYAEVGFQLGREQTKLTRVVDREPFAPADSEALAGRCEEILAIQTAGLARRLEHTGSSTAIVGISGGLDSTLALLVTVRAFDLLQRDRAGIIAITMPGFGTTQRTKGNAVLLAEALGVQVREVPIAAAVRQHFADIGHDEAVHDAAYENAQARERTQVLMDLANQESGLVVGTGDLSELALGWATFNGDHMSMYGVNADVPKTLIRHLVRHVAATCDNATEAAVLADVIATPVSPELLPADADGSIAQQTEDLVGPYELHDFFLYYVLRYGFTPAKVYRLACHAFADAYDSATILTWLHTFYRRFFAQQFKRNCLPDGPAVGSVGLSPRGGFLMPSDATARLWLAELEAL